MDLALFIKKLQKLKVAQIKGMKAPHKAVLLMSVIQAIEQKEITDNKIFITPELVARFKDNWHAFVVSEKFNPNFSLPFYHLKSEGFWNLKTLPGREILLTSSNSIRSFQTLKNAVAYAFLDLEVYNLLLSNVNREVLLQTLQSVYLGGAKKQDRYNLYEDVTLQILNDRPSEYRAEVAIADEEELFIRSGVFKKVVPRIYNYSCSISGMKINATREMQMIDACHIVPFAESHDDTITNGISLSPNLHRAFDRFLITINEHYEVIVSDSFTETGYHSIKVFHGKPIQLPKERKYYPSVENLKWHMDRFLKMHE
jgi:putative restriction endonuclease